MDETYPRILPKLLFVEDWLTKLLTGTCYLTRFLTGRLHKRFLCDFSNTFLQYFYIACVSKYQLFLLPF